MLVATPLPHCQFSWTWTGTPSREDVPGTITRKRRGVIIIDTAARFAVGGALRSHRRARAAIAMTSGTASETTKKRRNGCPSDGFAFTAVFPRGRRAEETPANA